MGQQEIGFCYDEVLVICDNYVIYKNGVKEIVDQYGKSLMFMVKYDECEGNSCYIYVLLCGMDGFVVFVDSNGLYGMLLMFCSFVVGQLVMLCEFMLCYVLIINFYK